MTNVKQCEICGEVEPPLWWEQPLNETIREYARNYVLPVNVYYKDLDEALDIWGENFNIEEIT